MGGDSGQTEQVDTRQLSQEEVDMGKMIAVMFADTEDIWHKVFKENGMQYREPKMELFDDKVNTQCGSATADVGPFYCPADETVYMDLRFFEELHTLLFSIFALFDRHSPIFPIFALKIFHYEMGR